VAPTGGGALHAVGGCPYSGGGSCPRHPPWDRAAPLPERPCPPALRARVGALGTQRVVDLRLPRHPLAHAADPERVIAVVHPILGGRPAVWPPEARLQRFGR